ncbi:MAG: hypothetical protein ACI8XX_000486 [Polaribacter sp.]
MNVYWRKNSNPFRASDWILFDNTKVGYTCCDIAVLFDITDLYGVLNNKVSLTSRIDLKDRQQLEGPLGLNSKINPLIFLI